MNFLFSELLYEYDKTINQHFQKQIAFISQYYFSFFVIIQERINKSFNNYICFISQSHFFIIIRHKNNTNLSSIIWRNKIYMHIYLNFPLINPPK